MTEQLFHLILASALFVGCHLVLSHPPVRRPLRERLGKMGFRGVYSIVSGATFTWMIWAYNTGSRLEIWAPPTFIIHGSLTAMLIAVFLIVCGATTPNPGMLDMVEKGLKCGPTGVLKITRHPVMWGITFWGISHALANGHLEGMVFFGSLAALALIGAFHIDYRKTKRLGDQWRDYVSVTSFFPFGALLSGRTRVEKTEIKWWQTVLTILVFSGFLIGHEFIFGPNVLPM